MENYDHPLTQPCLSDMNLFKSDFWYDDKKTMTRINFEDNFEIYLFNSVNDANNSSKLNEFLSFLKYHRVHLPYKFSFVSKEASLIPEMSLNQNILIDFSPESLTESKEVQFQEFLKAQSNRALEQLYLELELPGEKPSQSNAQMKKLSSLIKALIFEGDFIFLEEPESGLSPEMLTLFVSALKEHVKGHKINVFIYSKKTDFWMPHSHKLVERLKDYSFSIKPITKEKSWSEERREFYAQIKQEPVENGLKFIVPASKNQKKEAA